MVSKETIKLRLGDKEYNRILDCKGFIQSKSKLPKGYDGAITKYCELISTNFKGLFSIVDIDFAYSDTLCYVQVEPLSLKIAQ